MNMKRRRKTMRSYPVYCSVHKVVHWMDTEDIVTAMHAYQTMVAEITFAAPMPYVEGVSTPSLLLNKILCPVQEKEELNRVPLHSKFVAIMLAKARILTENVIGFLPSTAPQHIT